MDKLVCLEKSRWDILLWDDYTMGILSVTHLRGGQRDIWWFEAFCLPFSGTEGPPKGPWGSPTVLNGQTSVPWEFKIRYFAMEWFHYRNTERYSLERWTKKHLMNRVFCCFKGSLGSSMVINGQTSVPGKVEMKYSTTGWFPYGNTVRYSLERWTKGY